MVGAAGDALDGAAMMDIAGMANADAGADAMAADGFVRGSVERPCAFDGAHFRDTGWTGASLAVAVGGMGTWAIVGSGGATVPGGFGA